MPTTQRSKPKTKRRSRAQIKETLRRAFREEFPEDTVDVSDGYRGNIHVVVVSRRFDELSEREKGEVMWRIVENAALTAEEKKLISLLYPVSIAEIK